MAAWEESIVFSSLGALLIGHTGVIILLLNLILGAVVVVAIAETVVDFYSSCSKTFLSSLDLGLLVLVDCYCLSTLSIVC